MLSTAGCRLRRLFHHRLPGHRGVGHDRHARSRIPFRSSPGVRRRSPSVGPDGLRRTRRPDGDPYVGDPRHDSPARPGSRGQRDGFRQILLSARSWSTSTSRTPRATEPLDYGGVLRPDDAGRGNQRCAGIRSRRCSSSASRSNIPTTRSASVPARDRPALRRRAFAMADKVHDLQDGRQGDRHSVTASTPPSCPSR